MHNKLIISIHEETQSIGYTMVTMRKKYNNWMVWKKNYNVFKQLIFFLDQYTLYNYV